MLFQPVIGNLLTQAILTNGYISIILVLYVLYLTVNTLLTSVINNLIFVLD